MVDPTDYLRSHHGELESVIDSVSDPAADRRQALTDLTQRMAAHISVERSVLSPELKKRDSEGKRLAKRLAHDGRQIGRELVLIERRKANSPDLPELVDNLIELYRRHVRHFEDKVFPRLAGEMSRGELEDLVERMRSAEGVILSHPHPHLLSLGPISRITTRIASRIDRARDRTVTNR